MHVYIYESFTFVIDTAITGFASVRPRCCVKAVAEDTQPDSVCDYYTFSFTLSIHMVLSYVHLKYPYGLINSWK